MSIIERIRAHGGDIVRNEWRLTLKPGRMKPDAIVWLRRWDRWFAACCEAWPPYCEWSERAAILEFDAGHNRQDAERLAYEGMRPC